MEMETTCKNVKHVINNSNRSAEQIMEQAGYEYHCNDDGKPCYHRMICEHEFPRFHAYISQIKSNLVIDLHFDQYNMNHKSNHGESWAYEGGRVYNEMHRIIDVLKRDVQPTNINQSQRNPLKKKTKPKKKTFNVIDLLFRKL